MKFVFVFICFFIVSNANEKQENVIERGWRFGDIDKNKQIKKKSPTELLEELVKIQTESLKIQKIMLKKFDDFVDPKPKIITLKNGKRCVENSTAECFKMPLTNVAKKLPVLKNMILKPSKKTLGEWYKWQAKYFNKVEKTGMAASLALNRMNSDSFEGSLDRPSFRDTSGRQDIYKLEYQKSVLSKNNKSFQLQFYFGINAKLDKEAYFEYINFANSIPNLEYEVFFKSMESKMVFEFLAKKSKRVKKFLKNAKNTKLDRTKFKNREVYVTPMLQVNINKTKVYDVIAVAKTISDKMVVDNINYLIYKDMLKSNYLQDYKIREDQ